MSKAVAADVSEWKSGWRSAVASCSGASVGIGLYMLTASLFIEPMQMEYGLTRSEASIAPLAGLGGAFIAPFMGRVMDRIGARRTAITGLSLLAAIFLALAGLKADLTLLYVIVAALAVVGTMSGNAVFAKGVAASFRRKNGLALAVTLSGTSLVALAALPALSLLIERYGWRSGFLAHALLILVVGLPLVILWLREPASASAVNVGRDRGGDGLKDVLRDRRFWVCLASFTMASVAIGGFVAQMQPLLVGTGLRASAAAIAGSAFAVGIFVGRIGAGFFLDRYTPELVAPVFLSLACGGALLLGSAEDNAVCTTTASAAFLIGLGQGAEADFLAFFMLRFFGQRAFGQIFGVVALVVGLAIAGGGLLFAAAYDHFGDYSAAIYLASGLYAGSAVLILFIPKMSVGSPVRLPMQRS